MSIGDFWRWRVFDEKRDVVRYIVIPQAREEFLAASSVAIGMAWKAGVAAEVLALQTDRAQDLRRQTVSMSVCWRGPSCHGGICR